jgi:uncharacterized membrane-anchored protein YjiN (DUF445 family)
MKLANVDLSSRLTVWLSDPKRIDVFARHVTRLIPQLLDSLEEHHLRRLVSEDLQEHARRINLGTLLREALLMLTMEKRHQALLEKLLRAADEYVTGLGGDLY